MNRSSSKWRGIAARFVAYETNENTLLENKSPFSFPVIEKLRPHLAGLMGKIGFNALLSRAFSIAGREAAWLQGLHVTLEGNLEGRDKPVEGLSPAEILEGRLVLVATLLGLLETFIGEGLTFRLMRDVWPHLSRSEYDFEKGDKNEEAK